jgi:hypothetical protein
MRHAKRFAGRGRVRAHRPPRPAMFALVFTALAIGTGVFASAAAADQPVISPYTFSGTSVLTDACPFPVTVDISSVGTETDFVDSSGAVTRILLHFVEQDTFSANGKTLIGEPYTANAEFLFDSSGNLTHLFGQGVIEKVRLPDGTFFIAAGRVDFVARENPSFVVTPDVGAAVNLEGFCSALADP